MAFPPRCESCGMPSDMHSETCDRLSCESCGDLLSEEESAAGVEVCDSCDLERGIASIEGAQP